MRTLTAVLWFMLCTFAGGCAEAAPLPVGSWIGDATRTDGVDLIEVTVDSTGMSARVTLASWQVESVAVSRAIAAGDSLVFTAVVEKDTLLLTGTHANGRWQGAISLRERHAAVEMVRLFALGDAERNAMVGSYRTDSGHVIGIAPFSEFGSRLMAIDYETGRIGPAFPVSRDEFVVGRSIISPMFPADFLTLTRSATGKVEQIRFVENGRSSAIAARIATLDEEVQFSSGSVRLAGTLVLPPGSPPYPAIVLVHGSNAQTRDALGPWSRFFVAQGFAVLSYDKRGSGNSTGEWKSAGFHSLADDAIAGVRFLSSRSDIKRDRVGLWGISQGGWILPIVATKAVAEVAFLVVHAGSGTTVREEGVLYLQAELRTAGLPPSSAEIGTRYQQLDDVVTATGAGWDRLHRFYETQPPRVRISSTPSRSARPTSHATWAFATICARTRWRRKPMPT